MTIVRIGDKFAELFTEHKIHVQNITVVGFKHDWLGVWATVEVEYMDGTKQDYYSNYSLGLIGELVRNGYLQKIN